MLKLKTTNTFLGHIACVLGSVSLPPASTARCSCQLREHSSWLGNWLHPSSAAAGPPVYPKRPVTRRTGSLEWQDPYWWLTDWDQAAPWARQEQQYLAAARQAWHPRSKQLVQAIQQLTPPTQQPPLERCGPFVYSTTAGGAGSDLFRVNVETGEVQVLLSRDLLQKEAAAVLRRLLDKESGRRASEQISEALHVQQVKLSRDQQLLAYTLSVAPGSDDGVCIVRDLKTGQLLDDCLLPNVATMEWSAAGDVLLYTQPDHMGRPAQVLAHRLGSPRHSDVELLLEDDPSCFVSLTRTKDWALLLINSHSKLSSEVHLLAADQPLSSKPVPVQQRAPGLEYFVEHDAASDCLLVLTNARGSTNYSLMAVATEAALAGQGGVEQWQLLVPEDPAAAVLDMEAWQGGLVLLQMKEARPQLTLVDLLPQQSSHNTNNSSSSSNMNTTSSSSSTSTSTSRLAPRLGAQLTHAEQQHAPTATAGDPTQAGATPGAPAKASRLHVATHQVCLPPWVTSVTPGVNQDYWSGTYRVTLSSPGHPGLVCDYDLKSRQLDVLQDLSAPAVHISVTGGSGIKGAVQQSSADDNQHMQQRPKPGQHAELLQVRQAPAPAPPAAALCPGHPLWSAPKPAGAQFELVWVSGADCTRVPMTLISGVDGISGTVAGSISGPRPVLVMVYGAYGEVSQVSYEPYYLPLVRQGWVVALPHVRGGGELGRRWHAAGRQERKLNSVLDLLACIDHLVSMGVTRPGLIAGHAASAGGLTLAAALQRQPQLFAAAVLEVPYVDLLGSMSQGDAPDAADAATHMLLQHEYDEWGNPEDPAVLSVMKQLCPYARLVGLGTPWSEGSRASAGADSTSAGTGGSSGRREVASISSELGGSTGQRMTSAAQGDSHRPALLLTAGGQDARVPYWVPLRWAAACRAASLADLPQQSTAAGSAAAGARPAKQAPVYVQLHEDAGHHCQGLMSGDDYQAAEVLAFLEYHVSAAAAVPHVA